MTPLRVGVVGVGHLGTLHARMLAQLEEAELLGVYDRDPARASAVAHELGVRPCDSLDSLVAQVDCVTVAASTSAHHEVAMAALSAGKHVFIEKPITETVEEAKQLCQESSRRGLILQVGHIERFNPALLALQRFDINPLFIESHRLAQFNPRGTDVAVVLDLMIHDIDIILTYVRSPVRQVDASGVAVVSDTVDIANARLQFDNGCVANVTASRISQRKMRKMRLFQPNSYISIDFSEGLAEVFRLVGEDEPHAEGTLRLGQLMQGARKRTIVYEQPEVKEVNALKVELRHFLECVRTGGVPLVTGEDGTRALEVAATIMERISQQRVQLS
jgi:predicted dehydrogenase